MLSNAVLRMRPYAVALLSLAGCGSDPAPSPTGPEVSGACAAGSFDSTFEAIQTVIFERQGCTADLCHGSSRSGDLDLRAGSSYDNLIEVKSLGSDLPRVLPGQPSESFLYNKLRAATEPGSVQISGSPMPSGKPPLSPEHLEAVLRWIHAGAPQTGSIIDAVTGDSSVVARLLSSCLPEATPVQIKPLEPPAAGEGIQFAMPAYDLSSESEIEVCFAQYYDFSSIVPKEFQDPERGVFFINGKRTRQDPQSHHLSLAHSNLYADFVNHPSFGEWRCVGGENAGQVCDPLTGAACGTGACATTPQASVACIGFGPPEGSANVAMGSIGGGQTAQQYIQPSEGVYEEIPIKGIVYWNSHAFNLTTSDSKLHAWVNLFYTSDLRFKLTQPPVSGLEVVVGQPPFTKQNHCGKWTAPQDSKLYWITSHTHKRGGNFTIDDARGTRIYTSAFYSDPLSLWFTPPMAFDSPDEAARTLTYCAEFNNGVKPDGSPDLDLVTRSSRKPERSSCTPTGCVAGKIGAPCNGAEDNAACDSSPGAGDGWCDACPITSGVTTEDEMFFIFPAYTVSP